jgi:hypothetical protein
MARGEWRSTKDLVTAAIKILDAESPMTIRQLFYRLVSAGSIENDRSSYQRVTRMMTTARDDGRCDPTYIVDRSRPEYSPSVWENSSAYAEVVRNSYRKDYWATQPNHVEIWVEKDAIIGSVEDVTNELGVTIHVWRGFASTTKTHAIAQRFAKIRKPIVVFYLGDHDPSGRVIESDVRSRVQRYGSGPFRLERLAIFASDIKKFGLPPLRVKESDSRTPGFLRKYKDACVELDALPPEELRQRIRDAVIELLDEDLWNRAVAVEKVELASIAAAAAMWPSVNKEGGVS